MKKALFLILILGLGAASYADHVECWTYDGYPGGDGVNTCCVWDPWDTCYQCIAYDDNGTPGAQCSGGFGSDCSPQRFKKGPTA